MRNEINLSNEAIEELFSQLGGCANLEEEYGVDVTFTRETLADFVAASASYHECNKPRFEEVGGYKALCLDRAQPNKGDQRRDVIVIDFGSVRVVSQ